MKKRFLSTLLAIVMLLSLLPTTVFAEDSTVSVSTRAELKAALDDTSVTTINITASMDLSDEYWVPASVSRNLTIHGNGHTISGMKTKVGILPPAAGSVDGDGSYHYYYSGFIGKHSSGELVIENLTFEGANVTITEPADEVAEHGAGSLAVVVGCNSSAMTLTNVNINNCVVTGDDKVGGFVGQGAGPLTVNHCSVTNSTFSTAWFAAPISAYAMNTQYNIDPAKQSNTLVINGVKLSGNTVTVRPQDGESYVTHNGATYSDVFSGSGIQNYMVGCDTAYITYGSAKFKELYNGTTDYCCVPLEFEAAIGDYQYDTLANAITAAQSGDIVTLLKDVYLTQTVNILEDQNVVLDLAGKAITVSKSAGRSLYAIDNYGTFTLQDTVGGGIITARGTSNYGTMYVTGGTIDSCDSNGGGASVWNEGTLVVTGGTLKTSGERSGTYAATAINNYGGTVTVEDGIFDCTYHAIINDFGGKAIIKGGRYDVSGTDYAYAITNNEGCEMTISNAVVRSNCGAVAANTGKLTINSGSFWGGKYYGLWVTNDGTNTDVTINGGTFYGKMYGIYATVDDGGQDVSDVRIQINDGEFDGDTAAALGQKFTNNTWSLTIVGGYFTSDPTAYCVDGYRAGASDKAGYEYKVVEKKDDENSVTEVIPSTGDTTAKVAEGVTVDSEITTAVGGTTATGLAGVAMDEAAGTNITDSEKAQAEEALTPSESETISYHNQVYLDVTVNGVTTEGDKKKIDLDITAMSQLIASTEANPDNINLSDVSEGGNAVVVASKPITITTPVTISIPLPATFANVDDIVYVQHKSYEYEAVVTAGPAESGTVIATFTNPHGFSEFVITTSSVAVAKIDDVSYLSLQAAVDAVSNGQTINVLTAGQTATVSRTVKFTVTGETCTINLGTNYTDRDESASVFDIVYTEPTTPSTGGGGGGGSTTYSVTAPTSTKNGSVTVSPKSASKGKTVTITVKPDAGYELDKLTVTDKNGNSVTLTRKSDTQYTFTMPASKVEITAVFEEIPQTDPCDGFDDLDHNAWYHDAVNYVLTKGMMSGVSDDEFAPNATLTRAMVVQILWAVEGKPQVNYAMNYGDVSQSDWYAEAVRWAASQGIASGVADGSFAPNASITREQLMTMLYAYAQKKGEGFTGSWMFQLDFADQSQVSSWAYEPACWCTMNGVVSGKDGGRLDPVGTATRAEAAQMLMKFCQTLGE